MDAVRRHSTSAAVRCRFVQLRLEARARLRIQRPAILQCIGVLERIGPPAAGLDLHTAVGNGAASMRGVEPCRHAEEHQRDLLHRYAHAARRELTVMTTLSFSL